MFFWSKKKGEKAKSKPEEGTPSPITADTEGSIPAENENKVDGINPTVRNVRPDFGQNQTQTTVANPPTENLAKVKASQKQIAKSFTTLGELTNLLLHAENYKDYRLADLEWLILPAIGLNQFRIARAQSNQSKLSIPVAAVVWAKVSTEVDQKLSAIHSGPMRLSAQEWSSGDILWIILNAGDPRGVSTIINTLRKTDFKGNPVKIRVRDASGNFIAKTIDPA